ncbi:HU family DNA-binding protein [uncultured Mediterranea sp.]|uniref:HU family DNA-binding protein n=1 Tax=uncultured Mediterranea sp. TaxID=1926662 RepID=UPI0027D9C770|nr:HU family DNA-binding protein [uncultured Mediterranea sp.]
MNEKLNIQNLILLFAEKYDITPENAEEFVKTFFALIEEGLEQDKYVKVKGLGTFKLIEVGSRESINVNTGERFEIQGHQKVSFTPEAALKDLINRPFSHFETVVLNENVQFDDMPVEKEGEEEPEGDADEGMVAAEPEKLEDAMPQETPVVEKPVSEEPTAGESVTEESAVEEPVAEEPVGEESVVEGAVAEEQVSEPVPESEQEIVSHQPENNVSEKVTKYIVAAIVCVLLGCAGVVAYLYYPWSEKTDERLPLDAEMETPAVHTDTLAVNRKDSVAAINTVKNVKAIPTDTVTIETKVRKENQTTPPSKKKSKAVATPFVPDSVNYEIVGTQTEYTIHEGETLTRVSLKFYGTKALWPYLVKHNAGVLKNPDNVPSGTVIRIPKLAKKR